MATEAEVSAAIGELRDVAVAKFEEDRVQDEAIKAKVDAIHDKVNQLQNSGVNLDNLLALATEAKTLVESAAQGAKDSSTAIEQKADEIIADNEA